VVDVAITKLSLSVSNPISPSAASVGAAPFGISRLPLLIFRLEPIVEEADE